MINMIKRYRIWNININKTLNNKSNNKIKNYKI